MTAKAFDKIKAGLDEALAMARGEADPAAYRIHVPPEIDVKALRLRFGMTQQEFAAEFGFKLARLRDWEQGRSRPDGAMRAYLIVIDTEPKAVARALRASGDTQIRSRSPLAEEPARAPPVRAGSSFETRPAGAPQDEVGGTAACHSGSRAARVRNP